jgi:hypothetical protein
MNSLHAVSFDWEGFYPHLWSFESASGEMVDYDFRSLGYKISHHVVCVGNWAGGEYTPCPTSEIVKGGNVCGACATAFLPEPDCLFEPRCDGEECGMRFCKQEHSIYLAFHGYITKVGLTASSRLEQRMIEQGADAYAVIAEVKGRRTARKMEVAVADELVLRQRVRGVESLAAMAEPCPEDEIEKEYERLAERLVPFGHKVSELKFLRDYPVELPLKRMPVMVKPGGVHRGKALGVKGKFLIFENGGLKALNLQYVTGRFIEHDRARP